MRNHYYTLGLSENATPEEIKAAFKRLAVKYHPDKHMGNTDMEEKFKSVNQAYQVLSDPYKKAQFDLQLQYQRFHEAQSSAPPRQPYHYQPPNKPYGGRPRYTGRPVNHKENAKATLYAFAITFGIAIIVMVVKGVYDLYLQRKYDAFLADRREVFNEARTLFDQDQIKESLTLLSDISPFLPEEDDMKKYQTGIMEDLMFKGEANYLSEDFENAVRYFELVERFSSYQPMSMKSRLAESYREIGEAEEAVKILKQLIEAKYQVIRALVEIGEIYERDLRDTEMGLRYYELARDVAVKQYESRFGRAYMVVVTEEFIPREHYKLYRNLANLYNELDQPNESLGASGWMKRIWTDSADAWSLAGKSHELKNQNTEACREFEKARQLGLLEPIPNYCQ